MLSWEYPPSSVGGLGKHVMELIPALSWEGIEVHLFTPRIKGGEPYEQFGRCHIYRIEPDQIDPADFFSTVWQTNLRLQEAAYQIIEQHGPFDLIHAHDWLVAWAGVALKERYCLPLVATIHATERGRGQGYLPGELPRAINNVEWWLTYEAWRLICCSQYMASEVREYFETPADKIDIVFNAVNTTRFDMLDMMELDDFRNNYAAPDEKLIYFVGRAVEEKGLRVLIESAPIVLAGCPKSKFVVSGTGPQLQQYKQLAEQKGLAECFYFTGFISDDDRDKLYKVADVAVFPSLYEPFGIVALEGMAAKVPVVVADTGGLGEVVSNHQTGLKVYPNNPHSLAWGILHTLLNPDWSAARVKNAYEMVINCYNWREAAQLTIETYERVRDEFLQSGWGKEIAPTFSRNGHTEGNSGVRSRKSELSNK